MLKESKQIDISTQSIQLTSISKFDSKYLIQQNKLLKKQNQVLRRQLETLSLRLDGQIKKRLDQNKKKPLIKGNNDDVSYLQLQNAYKKCQIYKREASFYRKKIDNLGTIDKYEQQEKKTEQFFNENKQLRQQIKQLKKINKLQQKGLESIGAQGYLKFQIDNQKLQQETRRLKKQLDLYRRNIRSKTEADQYQTTKTTADVNDLDIKYTQQLKKKLKSQQSGAVNDLNCFLQQKIEKDKHKMRWLMNQNNKNRDLAQYYKDQLVQKDKEIAALNVRIANLRKNNQLLQSQANKNDLDNSQSREKNRMMSGNLEEDSPKKRVWKADDDNNRQSIVKWSHQQFNSKIKQIQVLLHQKGHIKTLHARYQKGEPKQYQVKNMNKFKVLSCSANQFITKIEGFFGLGYLQYLSISTNMKRNQKYGNWKEFERSTSGEKFCFEAAHNEYLGALSGQSNQFGITKLGCGILKQ